MAQTVFPQMFTEIEEISSYRRILIMIDNFFFILNWLVKTLKLAIEIFLIALSLLILDYLRSAQITRAIDLIKLKDNAIVQP